MKRQTRIIIVLAVMSLTGIDLLLLMTGGVEATFSRVVLDESRKHPIIPFSAGVLCGHLFWPQRRRR